MSDRTLEESERDGEAGVSVEGGEEAGRGEEGGAIGGEDKGDVEDGEDLDPRAIVEPVYGKRRNR